MTYTIEDIAHGRRRTITGRHPSPLAVEWVIRRAHVYRDRSLHPAETNQAAVNWAIAELPEDDVELVLEATS